MRGIDSWSLGFGIDGTAVMSRSSHAAHIVGDDLYNTPRWTRYGVLCNISSRIDKSMYIIDRCLDNAYPLPDRPEQKMSPNTSKRNRYHAINWYHYTPRRSNRASYTHTAS